MTDQAGEPGGSRASGPMPNKSSGTRRFFLFEWLGIGSSAVSSSSADPSIPSPDGWSKAEVLGWLISVALTAAGFKFGGSARLVVDQGSDPWRCQIGCQEGDRTDGAT